MWLLASKCFVLLGFFGIFISILFKYYEDSKRFDFDAQNEIAKVYNLNSVPVNVFSNDFYVTDPDGSNGRVCSVVPAGDISVLACHSFEPERVPTLE